MCYVRDVLNPIPYSTNWLDMPHFIIHSSLSVNGRFFYSGPRRFPILADMESLLAASSLFPVVYHHPFTPFPDLSLGWILPLLFCVVSFPSTGVYRRPSPSSHCSHYHPTHHRLSFTSSLVLPHRLRPCSILLGHLIFFLPYLLNGFPAHVLTHIPPSCPCLWLYRLSIYLSASSFCPPPRSGWPFLWGCTGEGAREMEEGAKWRVICRSSP